MRPFLALLLMWAAPAAAQGVSPVPVAPQPGAPARQSAPLASGNPHQPVPLAAKGSRSQVGADEPREVRSSPLDSRKLATRTAAALAVALGLFAALSVTLHKRGRPQGVLLPSEAVQVVGRTMLPNRQPLLLLRCGSKLLLVAITPGGAETLTEISEAREVNHLLAICEQASPHGASAAFRQVLEQLSGDPRLRRGS